MPLSIADWRRLEDKAAQLRALTLETVIWAGSGHIGGSLSSTDVLTVLYHYIMNIDPDHFDDPNRDRFVLSKGHIGVGYAPVLADKGFFPVEWLHEYNHTGSPLGMHPDAKKVPGVEFSTGSLGHGLSLSAGCAAAAKIHGADYTTYCLMGDGECDEGSVWEAAMSAAHFKLGNLIAFVDRNQAMIDGMTEDVMKLEPFADKWQAFGWDTVAIDGHDLPAIVAAIEKAKCNTEIPHMIILNTEKGAGIDFIQGDYKWHYGSFDAAKHEQAVASLKRYHEARLAKIKEN